MKGNKAKALKESKKEVDNDINLIRAPNAPQDKIKVMVTQQQPQENPLMEE
jgi:hypothetical protein